MYINRIDTLARHLDDCPVKLSTIKTFREMKKLILTVAIFAGAYTTSVAYAAINQNATSTIAVVSQEEWKEVKLEELSETIQKAVKDFAGELYNIAKLEFNEAAEQIRLTLNSKEDNSQKIVILDKEGKEVKN